MTNKLTNGYFNGAVARIRALQKKDGAIPWYEGGVVDPWNHLESVMGLNLCGEAEAVMLGFNFLFNTQLQDGSWWGQLGSAVPIDDELQNFSARGMDTGEKIRETNFTAYIATAIWHDYLLHQNIAFTTRAWPIVCKALDFVVRHQTMHGDIVWISHSDIADTSAIRSSTLEQTDALLTGNSSIFKSLACGLKLAKLMNDPQPSWEKAYFAVQKVLQDKFERFNRITKTDTLFSMDWYYPSLSGALTIGAASERLMARWDVFVVEGLGCRCVAHEPWVTVAETAELVLALNAIGKKEKAREILGWLERQRDEAGAYWIGYEYESQVFWPIEKPPWTAGAVILATDAVEELSPAHRLFVYDDMLKTL